MISKEVVIELLENLFFERKALPKELE